MTVPKVLFDANAARNFFRPRKLPLDELERLRASVLRRVQRGELIVMLTHPLFWELALVLDDPSEFGGRERYREIVEFLALVGADWFLDLEANRKREELRRRRRLSDVEAFGEIQPDALVSQSMTADWIDDSRRRMRETIDAERRREPDARTGTVAALEVKIGSDWREKLSVELTPERWERTVAHMTRIEMRRFASWAKMPLRGAAWPHARSAPTFWYGEAFLMAKAKRVFIEHLERGGDLRSKRSIKEAPGQLDGAHFRDAAYADILVTDDEGFLSVGRASRCSLRVIGQAEFASAYA